jgi:hypothetical protein
MTKTTSASIPKTAYLEKHRDKPKDSIFARNTLERPSRLTLVCWSEIVKLQRRNEIEYDKRRFGDCLEAQGGMGDGRNSVQIGKEERDQFLLSAFSRF